MLGSIAAGASTCASRRGLGSQSGVFGASWHAVSPPLASLQSFRGQLTLSSTLQIACLFSVVGAPSHPLNAEVILDSCKAKRKEKRKKGRTDRREVAALVLVRVRPGETGTALERSPRFETDYVLGICLAFFRRATRRRRNEPGSRRKGRARAARKCEKRSGICVRVPTARQGSG